MTKTEIQQISLYGGEVLIDYYPNSHQYKIDGQNIPSVTSITGIIDRSQPLLAWSERLTNEYFEKDGIIETMLLSNDIELVQDLVKQAAHQYAVVKQEAASIGDIVHDYAAAFARAKIDGKPLPKIDDVPQQALNGISAFLDWVKQHKVHFYNSEFVVYSKKLGYIGRCDALVEIDGRTTYLDYKTSKAVYAEAHLQLAAYSYAHHEEWKLKNTDDGAILRFDKQTGAFTVHPVKNLRKAFAGFKSALILKQVLKEMK